MINWLYLVNILLLLFVKIIRSDPNCIIGGIEADSCVNSRYIFNGNNYVIQQKIDLINGTVLEFGENTTVYFERSSSIHFYCNPGLEYHYNIDCIQIIIKGNVSSNAAFFTADVNLVDLLNEYDDSPSNIFFGEITSPQTDDYSDNSTTLTWPLFYLNITTNDQYNCTYFCSKRANSLFTIAINCKKQPISRAIDINVTHSYCQNDYSGFVAIIDVGITNHSVPIESFYLKNYLVNPQQGQGPYMISGGFYLRIYPGFDFNYTLNDFGYLISQKTFNEKCGPIIKVTSSYTILTPYGVVPLPPTSPPNTATPTNTPNSQETNSEDVNVSSSINFSLNLSILIYILIAYVLNH
ncbi:hypothetical protein DLAC_08478 [Tieghemostelium lacteum]|uniref:Uncharacterized protein n=1 Tax=Tieghemostelium lacteum TaxID=361077 RepID=A0A151Z7H6_TIELA|nr:hypothetical protein DLAC_08478 [Tieghemostelium lacteum]|eukprot:KYQ89911.1 hypothetical protein DLAC_08478 [Tieghemostelium lacteum]